MFDNFVSHVAVQSLEARRSDAHHLQGAAVDHEDWPTTSGRDWK